MSAEAIFVALLMLLGTGSLGIMVIMEVSRLGVLTARRAASQKRIDTVRAEADVASARATQIETAIEQGQAKLATLAGECQRLASVTRSIEADLVELVHDLGTPDGAPPRFRCVLRTVPDFARVDPRNVIFSRDIWQRKNVAHIWAETPEQAQALLQRTFPTRSGVLPGAIERLEGDRPAAEKKSGDKKAPGRKLREPRRLEPAEADLELAPQVAA